MKRPTPLSAADFDSPTGIELMDEPLIWAEVDLGAYARNLTALKDHAETGARIMAVVKADAYGHGAVQLARQAVASGVEFLGVARIEEALELREAAIEAPVVVFGHTPIALADVLIDHDLTQTVWSLDTAAALASRAADREKRLSVHVKVDTGMGRLGVLTESSTALRETLEIAALPGLTIDGIYTHFASADAADKEPTRHQLELFLAFVHDLKRKGLEIPLRHAANSAAFIDLPASHLDMARLGISTYGVLPSAHVSPGALVLEPVMALKARIMQLKAVPEGFAVSYGSTWRAPRPTTIATVAVGYADGLSRLLSSRGEMLVRGERVPIAGRVCMDLTMLDTGRVPAASLSDEVVVFGRQDDDEISASEVAGLTDTIPYEVLTSITARVPRVYRRS